MPGPFDYEKGIALFEQLKISNTMYRNGLSYCGLLYSNLNDTLKANEYLNDVKFVGPLKKPKIPIGNGCTRIETQTKVEKSEF